MDGSQALDNDEVILTLLNNLLVYGACVLENSPTHEGYLLELAERIGPVRDSNFGMLWDVKADVELAGDAKTNSTANTGLRLGPHSDLPTREIPPGFQFLHCLINEADGGESTLTDGAALVEALERDHPEAFDFCRHGIGSSSTAAPASITAGPRLLLIICLAAIRRRFARFTRSVPSRRWPMRM